MSKIERGLAHDLEDVRSMIAGGLVEPDRAMDPFAQIEPDLFRFRAIDAASLRRRVEAALLRD